MQVCLTGAALNAPLEARKELFCGFSVLRWALLAPLAAYPVKGPGFVNFRDHLVRANPIHIDGKFSSPLRAALAWLFAGASLGSRRGRDPDDNRGQHTRCSILHAAADVRFGLH